MSAGAAIDYERELLGRVWDTWGSLTIRQKRRIGRQHPALATVLALIEDHVTSGLRFSLVRPPSVVPDLDSAAHSQHGSASDA